ncbi:MAG: HNH endonuclease [Lachnospiraceae bacterium]
MNYFFVFQNKSYYEEYKGGYLWAPQYGSSGRKVSHWEKMKSIKQGDIIIHSYHKQIKAISVAKEDVYEAKRPVELSAEWQQEGWRVDCEYRPFIDTICTSDYSESLLALQPKVDAPFNRLGRGNTGYLFDANREMYEFFIQQIARIQKSLTEKQRVFGLLNLVTKGDYRLAELEIEMEIEATKAKRLPPEKLAEQIQKTMNPKKPQKTDAFVYYRSPYIKEMVKYIADGKCQMCGEKAPFYDKENKPYLEEHHVKRLADGGSDSMDNVVAVCPNCHRRVHVLKNEMDAVVLEKIAGQNEKFYQRLLVYTKKLKNE